jgi:hypothetical protein
VAESAVLQDLRYPIGRYSPPAVITPAMRESYISSLAAAPAALRAAVEGLDSSQLETPYREDGWSVAQVTHHLADSHANAYVRVRLALTEDAPTIKPFDEDRWAQLADAKGVDIARSVELFDALHHRLVNLLRSLAPADFERVYVHPERAAMTVDRTAALYSWHGAHHTAHITGLRRRLGW